MNKFLIAFAAVLAVCSRVTVGYGNNYGSNYGSNVGGYLLTQRPSVTVQLLVPSYGGSYGQNSYGQNSYGSGYGPAAISVPSYGDSYGSNSYGGVDAQAVNLAIQALNAPSAGLPPIADPVITPNLITTYGPAYSALPASYSSPAVSPSYGGSSDAATGAAAAAAASNVNAQSNSNNAAGYR